MSSNFKYCVIIPAYQSSTTLPSLLQRIISILPEIKIIVVNDGSTDNTKDLIKNFTEVEIINHDRNYGKGYALKTGIKSAQKLGYNFAITLDSDLQHTPEKILDFLRAHRKEEVPLILGRRRFNLNVMPLHRILSNTITSFIISIRTGRRIHDSQCGFRLFDISNIKAERFKESGFQFESEFLLKTLPSCDSFKEIEVPTIYNRSSRSHIRNIKDTLKFILLTLRSYFDS